MSRISDDALAVYLDQTSLADDEHARRETRFARDLRDARSDIARLTEELAQMTIARDFWQAGSQLLEARQTRAEARLAAATTVTDAAKSLIDKLDLTHEDPGYKHVWVSAMLHGAEYSGPKYDGELSVLRAALTAFVASKQAGAGEGETAEPKRIRHKKRGSFYTVIAEGAQIQTSRLLSDYEKVAVYRGDDGSVWVRPMDEMNDGRFEPPAPAPRQEPQR